MIAIPIKPVAQFLAKGVDLIEYLGRIIVPFIPLFMLGIGAYITILPEILEQELGRDSIGTHLNTVYMAGFSIDISTSWGMIFLYIVGALATGIACMLWHGGLIVIAKSKTPSFSL